MGNTVDCSHPPASESFTCEVTRGDILWDLEKQDPLLDGFNGLLQRHCEKIGKYVDERLKAHHEELLRSLAGDESLPPTSVRKLSTPTHGRMPVESTVTEMSPPPKDMLEAYAWTKSAPRIGTCKEPKDLEGLACSFEESEEKRKSKSLQVKRIMSESSSRFPTKDTTWSIKSKAGLRRIIEAPWFEAWTCSLIMTNVIFLGVEVQASMGQSDSPGLFKVVEFAYTTLFTLELLLRFGAYGLKPFMCGDDKLWNTLDMALVLISVTEVFLEIIQGSTSDNFAYARIIRMFRTVRIFRVVRLMKFFRPLRILFYSVLNTVRSLCWTLVLLAIIMYLFGVIFTMAASQALSANQAEFKSVEPYFGSLWVSIATLFQSITGGLDWYILTKSLGVLHPALVVFFFSFIMFSQLAFLNVVTGVVCHGAIESAQQDQDILVQSQLAAKETWIKQLEEVFVNMDKDQDGSITLKQFERRLEDQDLQDYFAAMDLTTDEAWSLFKLLDSNESCMIDIDEFVSGCLKLRGAARSIDVHMLMYESKWTMKRLSILTRAIEELYEHIHNEKKTSRLPNTRRSPSQVEVGT